MSDSDDIQLTMPDVPLLYGKQFFVTDAVIPATESAPEPAVETAPETAPAAESKQAAPTPEPPKPEVQEQPAAPAAKPAETPAAPAAKPAAKAAPGINWRPKESSKVLFILHQSELKNKVLTELLKQIVAAIEIPFPSAGFGIIVSAVQPGELDAMPNPYGIVFDETLLPGADNPAPTADGAIFYTMRLKNLQHDRNAKRALWEFLKSIKPKL